MKLAAQLIWEGASLLLAGVVLGYGIFLWRQRRLNAAHAAKEKLLLENAQREAEAVLREARLAANEEALKLREQTQGAGLARQVAQGPTPKALALERNRSACAVVEGGGAGSVAGRGRPDP